MDDILFRHYSPKSGDIVVDIGAGHGGETFALAHMVGPSGTVLSFEASPTTYGRLTTLCRLNGWRQVQTVHAAVAEKSGAMTISEGDSWLSNNIYEPGEVTVAAVTLDEVCSERGIEHIDWLKMNIEGAEKDAIQGMEAMSTHIRHMTVSCHDFLGTDWGRSRVQVTKWLLDHGFTVQGREGDTEPWFRDYIYAWRP